MGTADHNGRFRALADSTVGIVITRYVVPPIIAALAGLATLVLHNLDASITEVRQQAKDANQTMWNAIQKTNEATTSTHEAVEVLIQKFESYQAARSDEIGNIKGELSDHEVRLRTLEQTHTR